MPIDRTMLDTREFRALLGRLRDDSDANSRNHWVKCSACSKWRRVKSHATAVAAKGVDWTCSFLNEEEEEEEEEEGERAAANDDGDGSVAAAPPRTLITCDTPQSKEETVGIHYAPRAAVERGIASGFVTTQVGDGPVQRQEQERREAVVSEAPGEVAAADAAPPPPSAPFSKRPAAEQQGEEFLTALELARQARMAANRAYFEGIGLGLAGAEAAAAAATATTTTGNDGGRKKRRKKGAEQTPPPPTEAPPRFLPHDHPSILAAARDLARKAAAATAAAQLASARARLEAGTEKRRAKIDDLRARLAAAEAEVDEGVEEVAAAEEVARAVAGIVS